MVKVRLSQEAIYYLADAFAEDLKKDINKITSSSIALNDFEKEANDLIHKLKVAKDINRGFLEAKKELEQ